MFGVFPCLYPDPQLPKIIKSSPLTAISKSSIVFQQTLICGYLHIQVLLFCHPHYIIATPIMILRVYKNNLRKHSEKLYSPIHLFLNITVLYTSLSNDREGALSSIRPRHRVGRCVFRSSCNLRKEF